ncbi:MAG: tyrosine-type recombinase/integrase [Candidatus Pacearchaeota archaeon]
MEIKHALKQYVDYLTYFKKLSPYSTRRIRQEVYFLANECNLIELSDLTEKIMYEFFLRGNTTHKWQTSTICVKHITIKSFFKWCISKGYMSINPLDTIPRPKKDKKIAAKLTKAEAIRILDVAYHLPYKTKFLRFRNHAMLAICLYAGLRKSEMISLKYADVDTDNFTIFVRCGKGRKDRMIPMSHALANILREYKKERANLKVEIPEFFVAQNGKRPIKISTTGIFLKRYRKITGITFSFHKLRHTFATLMIEGGCDIYSLSKMMGHSDISTTTIYLAASVEHLQAQILKHPLNNI